MDECATLIIHAGWVSIEEVADMHYFLNNLNCENAVVILSLSKNIVRDEDNTTLYTADTVDAVDMAYTVDIINKLSLDNN